MFMQDISDITMLRTSVQPDIVPVCKTQLRLHSLTTVMSWSTKGNVHLHKTLEVIKIQIKTKGDIKEKFSGQIHLHDLLDKKASLLLRISSLGELLLNCTADHSYITGLSRQITTSTARCEVSDASQKNGEKGQYTQSLTSWESWESALFMH